MLPSCSCATRLDAVQAASAEGRAACAGAPEGPAGKGVPARGAPLRRSSRATPPWRRSSQRALSSFL